MTAIRSRVVVLALSRLASRDGVQSEGGQGWDAGMERERKRSKQDSHSLVDVS